MDSRSDEVRFMSWVVPSSSGHWMWQGATARGYGRTTYNGRGHPAHRVAWMLFRGEIPEGMHIHHVCYVRACVNPDHLEVRTPAANLGDVSALRPERKKRGPNKQRKAVCKHGHPMEGDNVAWTTRSSGRVDRYCRTCAVETNRAQYAKHAEARRASARTKSALLRAKQKAAGGQHVATELSTDME